MRKVSSPVGRSASMTCSIWSDPNMFSLQPVHVLQSAEAKPQRQARHPLHSPLQPAKNRHRLIGIPIRKQLRRYGQPIWPRPNTGQHISSLPCNCPFRQIHHSLNVPQLHLLRKTGQHHDGKHPSQPVFFHGFFIFIKTRLGFSSPGCKSNCRIKQLLCHRLSRF